MASEVEPPFVSAAKTKGGSTPRPHSLLFIERNVGRLAAPATRARRSGRHDIPLGFSDTPIRELRWHSGELQRRNVVERISESSLSEVANDAIASAALAAACCTSWPISGPWWKLRAVAVINVAGGACP